jgi:ABC-2 type transport system ATP-binding protein
VFLSSHSLDEVQHAADRVGIIRAGRLIGVDRVAELREHALRHITVRYSGADAGAAFAAIDGVRVQEQAAGTIALTAPESAMDAVVKTAAGLEIVDLVSAPADLEEIFLEAYREAGDAG